MEKTMQDEENTAAHNLDGLAEVEARLAFT